MYYIIWILHKLTLLRINLYFSQHFLLMKGTNLYLPLYAGMLVVFYFFSFLFFFFSK